MRLLELETKKWQVLSVVNADDTSVIEQYIDSCTDNAAFGITNLFVRFSEFGHKGFSPSLMHEVNKDESIYQFTKGRHRILFFSCEGRAIVVSCPHIKTNKKVDPKQVKKAIRLKKQYLEAIKNNTVVIFQEEDDDEL